MKPFILITLFCCGLAGCSSFAPAPEIPVSAETSEPLPAPVAAPIPLAPTGGRMLIAERIEQVQQLEAHVEQLAMRWPHSTPQTFRAIRQARDQLAAYLQMTQGQQTSMATQGVTPGRDFYRQELAQLDALASSLRAMEEIIVKTP